MLLDLVAVRRVLLFHHLETYTNNSPGVKDAACYLDKN